MKTFIKTCIFVLLLLITGSNTFAQEYKQRPEIDKFVGTWVGAGTNLQIVITKQKLYLPASKIYYDIAVGWHIFASGGMVFESSMNNCNKKFTSWNNAYDFCTILGGTTRGNYIIFSFKDISKNKRGEATLEMLPGKTDEARWTLKEESNIVLVLPGSPPAKKGFTVPTNTIMKKISNSTIPPASQQPPPANPPPSNGVAGKDDCK